MEKNTKKLSIFGKKNNCKCPKQQNTKTISNKIKTVCTHNKYIY